MARAPKTVETWFSRAAEIMVRENKKLRQAAFDAGVTLTPEEADNVGRRKAFQKLLTVERNRYHAEIGGDPSLNKTAVIGNLQLAATKLMEIEKWHQAAQVLLALAKVQGWVGSETNVNVFGNLNAQDIENLRTKLKSGNQPGASAELASELPN